ncbi:hypothetical protein Scep_018294 [Stephania cephalantha]|uniref:Protein TIFY n=1 Tax=Stephania cephalantha TaxID=152367 RepID=A0AAP0IR70_9MAGN
MSSRGGQVDELDFWRMEREMSCFNKSRYHYEFLEPRTFVRGVRSSSNSETFAGSGDGIGSFRQTNYNGFLQPDRYSEFRSHDHFHENRSTIYSPPRNNPNLRGGGGAAENSNSPGTSTAPLTIFYKGTVSVFNVPSDKAALIIKLAEEGNLEKIVPAVHHHHHHQQQHQPLILDHHHHHQHYDGFQFYSLLSEELPIARTRSLRRFLERRKERYKNFLLLARS